MAARGLGVAAPAGRQHDGAGVDRRDVAVLDGERRAPAARGGLERGERVVLEARGAAGFVGIAERLRDRVAGAVADLEQPLARRAAAAREAVAAVLAREGAAELLEPVDRALRVTDESLDEARIGGLVRRAHDVLRMQLRRVVGRRRRPGSRPGPWTSCSPGSSPWSRERRSLRRGRQRRRRRDPRHRCRSRARRIEPRAASGLGYQVSLFVALQSLISLGRLERPRRSAAIESSPWPGSPT